MSNQLLWERFSPYTEGIRWLVEMAVICCGETGQKVRLQQLDRLIELARAIYEWDLAWETIAHKVVEQELIVSSGFSITTQLTSRGTSAAEA